MHRNYLGGTYQQRTATLPFQIAQARDCKGSHVLEDWRQTTKRYLKLSKEKDIPLPSDCTLLNEGLLNQAFQQRIEQAAFLLAENRHFEAGHSLEDWLVAECNIEAQLNPSGVFSSVHHRIEHEAYYRAEKRNFAPGMELDDWCAAEREVEILIRQTLNKTTQVYHNHRQ